MKFDLGKLSESEIQTTVIERSMRLSDNTSSMVFQLFTKNVYSNPIGTVVREITSNCFDSHVEAGVNLPVIIRYGRDNENNTHYISFIDFGVGMSPERIYDVYGVYFESTKRIDNEQIGGFGIGGKTPLAYKRYSGQSENEYDNSFHIITNYNGIKYYYLIYEGLKSPMISELYSEPTTDGNGTEIRIPVLEKDLRSFYNEMIHQLYYFENIIFENFDKLNNNGVDLNQYEIVRGENFLYRGSEYSNYMHVCLGRVAYKIDYKALGLYEGNYQIPVAIRLNVGDINVTVSREAIDYSQQTIKFLTKKLEEVKEELKEILIKQYDNIVTLKDYFEYSDNFGVINFPNRKSLYISGIVNKKNIKLNNFKYNSLSLPNDNILFSLLFTTTLYGKKNKWSSSKNFSKQYAELKNKDNILFVDGGFDRKVIKQAYLKAKYETFHIIQKLNIPYDVTNHDCSYHFEYKKVYTLNPLTNEKELTDFGKTLIEIQNDYFEIIKEYCTDYAELEVPQTFIDSRKKRKTTENLSGVYIPGLLSDKYSKEQVRLDKLIAYRNNIFYYTKKDEGLANTIITAHKHFFPLNNIISRVDYYTGDFITNQTKNNKNSVVFIMMAENNVKYMKHCKKAYHITEYYHKMLYRKVEEIQKRFNNSIIVDKFDELSELFISKAFETIDTGLHNKINKIKEMYEPYLKAKHNPISDELLNRLKSIFNIDDVGLSAKEKELIKLISEVMVIQRRNKKIFDYVSVPYRIQHQTKIDETFLEIIKKLIQL